MKKLSVKAMIRNRNSSVTPDMSVWVLEISCDEGETWTLVQSFGMYITQERAEARAKKETAYHKENIQTAAYCYGWMYRARRYRPAGVSR